MSCSIELEIDGLSVHDRPCSVTLSHRNRVEMREKVGVAEVSGGGEGFQNSSPSLSYHLFGSSNILQVPILRNRGTHIVTLGVFGAGGPVVAILPFWVNERCVKCLQMKCLKLFSTRCFLIPVIFAIRMPMS